MLNIKHGVSLSDLQPQIILGLISVLSIYESYGYALTITAISDGIHRTDSLHFYGRAVDVRTRDITDVNTLNSIVDDIRRSLGSNFDVILEPTHLHIEYDPN